MENTPSSAWFVAIESKTKTQLGQSTSWRMITNAIPWRFSEPERSNHSPCRKRWKTEMELVAARWWIIVKKTCQGCGAKVPVSWGFNTNPLNVISRGSIMPHGRIQEDGKQSETCPGTGCPPKEAMPKWSVVLGAHKATVNATQGLHVVPATLEGTRLFDGSCGYAICTWAEFGLAYGGWVILVSAFGFAIWKSKQGESTLED